MIPERINARVRRASRARRSRRVSVEVSNYEIARINAVSIMAMKEATINVNQIPT